MSSSTILTIWFIYFIKHRILLKSEWLFIHWMFFCLMKRICQQFRHFVYVFFDYWSKNFAFAHAFVSQCNTNNDKMSDSKHFFFFFIFFNFSFHSQFYRSFSVVSLTFKHLLFSISCFKSLITIHFFVSIH